MKLYRVEVQICATAYIKAPNAGEAFRIAAKLKDDAIELPDDSGLCGEIEITGMQYSDPDLPDVSLSPAMTIHGVWPGAQPEEAE